MLDNEKKFEYPINTMTPRKQIKQVEDYLKRTGLKRYQLEDLAGVPRTTIYKFVSGERNISLGTWLKIDRIINRV